MESTNDPKIIRSVLHQIEHLQDTHKKECVELLDGVNKANSELLVKVNKERTQLIAKNAELLATENRNYNEKYQASLDKMNKEEKCLRDHLDILKKENEELKEELYKFYEMTEKCASTNALRYIRMLVIIYVFYT